MSEKLLLAEKTTGRPSRLQIQDYAAEMSKKYNVPLEIILRHLWIESGYNINARSSADAFGLMQLLAGTAQTVGVNRQDWRQNIEGGTRYLSRMYKRYNGKTPYPWVAASMSYFTGPGNIDKTLKSATKLNMEIVDYVIMKKNQKSKYHTSIFNYANAIYDNNHRRNRKRPSIETTLAPRGINVNIHPGVADASQSINVSPGATVAAAAAQTQQPKKPSVAAAPVMSSKKVKKISHLTNKKRPTIKIQTDEQGKATISYEGNDPIGKGLGFQPRDLDKEVNRLFGYASWSDYIKDNKEDLSAKTQTDDKGNVLSGPTVHPIHVAYALEEFVKTASPDDYTLVGVPKGAISKNIIAVQAISGLRRGLFGDSKGTVSLSRLGILNSAMYGPIEGLQNVATIEKAKKASGVAAISTNIKTTVMPVEHPESNFWNKTFSPQTTDSKDVALAFAPSETGAPLQVLSESAIGAILRGIGAGAKALSRFISKGKPADNITRTIAKKPGGGTTIDQLTKAAKKDVKNLYKNQFDDAAVERALRKQLRGKIPNAAADDVIDAAKAYARRKGISDTTRAAVGKTAAAAAKQSKGSITFKDIVKTVKNVGGVAGGVYSVAKAKEFLKDKDMSDEQKGLVFLFAGVLGGAGGYFATSLLYAAIKYVTVLGGAGVALDIGYNWNQEQQGKVSPGTTEKVVDGYKDLLESALSAAAESLGIPSAPEDVLQILKTADKNEKAEQYATQLTQYFQNQTATAVTATASDEGDLEFYLVPKNWRSGTYYTEAEGVLAQRIGANLQAGLIITDQGEQTKEQFLNWAASSLKSAGLKKPSGSGQQFAAAIRRPGGKQTKINAGNVLIFGHSQSGPTAIGGALESAVKGAGLQVTRITINGASDNSLVNKLKNIPDNNYKQAYLFLNGNVYESNGDLMEASKVAIVNHMTNNLKIPKQNILVILPPVNRDSEKSVRRYNLSKRAASFFAARDVKVADIIISDAKSFSDDIHIKGGAAETKSSVAKIVSGLSSIAIAPSRMAQSVSGPAKRRASDPPYAYTFGGLAAGTPVYSSYNENQITGHGASMNKPILALIHMMMYKQAPRKLTDQELRAMLAYTGGESNTISKLASGVNSKYSARDAERKKTIGTVSDADAARFLSKLGLDSSMRIRWNNNKQTPKQFFDFMRLIHNKQKISSLGIENEINKILSYMRRDKNLGVSIGGDRESKRWPVLLKAIQDKGLQVSKIYGKGGLVPSGFHYALVIDDKYLLTMYSKRPIKGKEQKKHINWFSNKVADILATVVPRRKAKANENLLAYKPLIAGVTK